MRRWRPRATLACRSPWGTTSTASLGIVHWGSVVDGDDDLVGTRVQPALMLPDTVRLSDALRRFREERQQMAIVVDEHGSVDGIVTLEDLLEEVVGEIWDETDPDLADASRGPTARSPSPAPSRSTTCPTSTSTSGCPRPRTTRPSPGWCSRCWAACPTVPATSSRSAGGASRSPASPATRSPRCG